MASSPSHAAPEGDAALAPLGGSKDERVQARKERVKRKMEADGSAGASAGAAEEEKALTQPQQQTADSLTLLDHRKSSSINLVTGLRVEADWRENRRRVKEEEERQDRLSRLQEEAVESGKRNASVEMRWAELMEYGMPQELNEEIVSQKQACDTIVQSKDNLISEFQTKLKEKDEEYVKALRRQTEDVDSLVERMGTSYAELRAAYEQELQQIEDAFLQERGSLMQGNREEMNKMFEERRQAEMDYFEAHLEREMRHLDDMDGMRANDAEEYNKLKIKMQTDIQTLQQQLGEMRATYLLNTEKLEYNYRLLREREVEYDSTKMQQTKKIRRLKDMISKLRKRLDEADRTFRHQNGDLTEEYRRITRQYKELQRKFRHFESADRDKYQEVFGMHEGEVNSLAAHVMRADRVLTEQQLGWQWRPPQSDAAKRAAADETDLCDAVAAYAAESVASSGAAAGRAGEGGEEEEGEEEEVAPRAEVSAAVRSAMLSANEAGEGGEDSAGAVRNEKIKRMLELLVAEAEYLVDEGTLEALARMDEKQARVARADAVLKAIGVEREEDVDELLSYFFDPSLTDAEPGEDVATLVDLNLKVGADAMTQVLKAFVDERERRQREAGIARVSLGKKQNAREIAFARRERARKMQEKFWNDLANVVPEASARAWRGMEQALERYNGVLKQRSDLVGEVSSLHEQNMELKSLLNQYLGEQVNEELHVPPSQVIRVRVAEEPAKGSGCGPVQ